MGFLRVSIAVVFLALHEATARPKPGATIGGPAKPCVADQCKLPNCRCAGMDIPGGLAPQDTPQIVAISFDDGLRVQDYETYYSKVFQARKNPNGCPTGLTFFVSHNYTDYALVEDLYHSQQYEMADHSVDHREPTTWWENATLDEWTHEIMDEKTILEKWGNIPANSIKGFRSPFLVTSENEIKALYNNNFTYEATMGTTDLYWPFTLDYKSPICTKPATCPEDAYPGLWLTPIVLYQQDGGPDCAMLDACTVPQSEEDWFNFFMKNFNRHYNGNRAPFGIYSHSAWFYLGEQRASALNKFLDELATKDDVYLITHSQLIQWMRTPTPLSKIKEFDPWKCPQRPAPRCTYKSPTCSKSYTVDGTLQNFRSCTSPCPQCWPQYGDPYGNGTCSSW